MAPTERGHGNGRVMNGWTSEEPGTTTRIDLPTTFFDGHVSECSKVECVCVFLRVFLYVHPRWLAGFLPSKQPDFEICFPWCLTHSNSLGEVS